MKIFAILCFIFLAGGLGAPAMAQSLPGMSSMPGSGTSGAKLPSMPGSSTSTQSPSGLEQAKTELTCKIPSNMTKPECIALMMKK